MYSYFFYGSSNLKNHSVRSLVCGAQDPRLHIITIVIMYNSYKRARESLVAVLVTLSYQGRLGASFFPLYSRCASRSAQ